MKGSVGGQFRDEIVRDAVRDLIRPRPVCIESDDRADDRSDRLTAERELFG